MNKEYIIKKNDEIQYVMNNKDNKFISNFFVIYAKKNNFEKNRYCISVSKKIGKANIRNLYKRRIKDILMKNALNNSMDYVIILRNAILNEKYYNIQKELLNILGGKK